MMITDYMDCEPTGSLIYLSFDKGLIAGASCRYDFEGLR
jgi:hypothetical protein